VLKGFMAQAGCPLGKGYGGPGYTFPDEINKNSHDKPGTISMANAGPNTNGSQFFLTFVPTTYLDPKHTVFGRVADDASMKVLNSIMLRDPDRGGPSDSIKTVTISNKTAGKTYEVKNTKPSNR
jgi:cyclophilin family peptidyl-prolyl cis-trans isomerase